MKHIIYLFFAVLISITTFSQDTLTTKKGDQLIVKVLEVGTNVIKYKKSDNLDGPAFETLKSEIFMIKYQNGTKDVFNGESISEKNTDTPDVSCFQAKKDAKKYYHRMGFAGGGTLIASLVSPLLGLIPAIACSSSTPKDSKLDYPDALQMKNNIYNECYTNAAKKKKSRRVWTMWGIGLGVNIVAIVVISQSGL